MSASGTFKVCDVEKGEKLLAASTYEEVLLNKVVVEPNRKGKEEAIQKDSTLDWKQKQELQGNPDYFPEGIPNRKIESFASKEIPLIPTSFHPFMQSMHQAYGGHHSHQVRLIHI